MNKIRKAINDFSLKLYVKAVSFKNSAVEAVTNTEGDAYIDTVVKILIAVVVGALILWGLYALMEDVVMEELEDKISELFNKTKTSSR